MSARVEPKRTVVSTALYVVLGLLVVLAIGVGVSRLVVGLGATTNLSNSHPWGLWIAFDVFAVPFSAGAFTLAAIVHIFNRHEYHGISRFSVLAGFLGYLLVVLVLLIDLGRWDQFYSVLMPWRWNLHSFMFEVSMSITVYFGVLVLELVSIIFEGKDWLPVQIVNRLIVLISGVGVLLSTVHQGSLGALFLLLRTKLSPIWWTPILPVLFLTSALISGLSVTLLLAIVSWRALGRPAPARLLSGLAKIAAVLLAIYLALKIGDLIVAGELGLALTSGKLTLLFLVEIAVGVVAPLIIFASRARETTRGLLAGAICVLLGLLVNRPTVAWFALESPGPETYAPSWMEYALLAGAISFGILGFSLALKKLEPIRETVTEGSR
jgi:Ni/Fe-hydrogenase subunit HybB-like protein